MNEFNLSAAQQNLLDKLLAALKNRGFKPQLNNEDGQLYLQLSDTMRGNLTELLSELSTVTTEEIEVTVEQIVKEVALAATGDSLTDISEDDLLTRIYPCITADSEVENACHYGIPVAGDLVQILALDSSTGPVQLSGSMCETLPISVQELQQQGLINISEIKLAQIVQLDTGMTILMGESSLFASRILDFDSLLQEAKIDSGPLGVFFALPCATAIIVMPVQEKSVLDDAVTLIKYVGELLSDPEFVQARGVLSEYTFHWNPSLNGIPSITCIERQRIIDGEEYLEVVMPDVLTGLVADPKENNKYVG